jgi:hypothetical protein
LDDNTSGQNFRYTEPHYEGRGTTTEYVVDSPISVPVIPAAATDPPTEAISALADYSPAVQFTNLHTVGGDRSIAAVLLDQNGVQVSTPSVYTSAGFTVSYGSIVPTAP